MLICKVPETFPITIPLYIPLYELSNIDLAYGVLANCVVELAVLVASLLSSVQLKKKQQKINSE